MDTRPSKKQRELLSFIDGFIKGNGYGPSYREVMRALDYRSVSTVAVHVNGLITRGLLRKKDNSARSLEVVGEETQTVDTEFNGVKWLEEAIKTREKRASETDLKEAAVLTSALEILQAQHKTK